MRGLLVIGIVMASLVTPAAAHQTSLKHVELVVDDEGVAVTVLCAPSDVTEAMGLPADASPAAAIAALHPAVPAYVQQWLTIASPRVHDSQSAPPGELAPCTAGRPSAHVVDASFFAVTWTATCDNPRRLALDFTRFFALDSRHEAVVVYTAPHAEPISTIVRSSEPRVTLSAGHSPSLFAWVRTGMDHIYSGLDHIIFVLSLLLVVMLVPAGRSESGPLHSGPAGPADTGWRTRTFGRTLGATALVITSFTIAHSLTLILAALGIVELPSDLVEALIAISIAYTAAEDVVDPVVPWRFALTFAFGLVHGLGFASQLAVLLPDSDVVVPLLCFNLGVEIGQLSIVAVALPPLILLARMFGATRYRRWVLPILAAPIFLLGVAMAVERVFGLSLLPM